MKEGQIIKMKFYIAGVASFQNVTVISFDDNIITVNYTWHNSKSGKQENGKFDRKTGKCLNDNISYGASRSISPQ